MVPQLLSAPSAGLVLIAAFGAGLGLPAAAQTQAHGLWEHAFTLQSADGQMEQALAEAQAQIAAMPPEQRQQIEQALAGRGVSLGAKGTSARYCLTKEQATRPAEPRMSDGCTQQIDRRSGRTVSFHFQCTRPQATRGEGEITFQGDKAYTGRSTVTSTIDGTPQTMRMQMAGKWLGAECGAVRPVVTPAQ
jgi:Protein of unknown function (DUF3617)